MEIYSFETSKILTVQEFKNEFPTTGFPAILTHDLITDRGYGVVLASPQPQVTDLQYVVRDGAEIDAKGNVVQKWKVVNRFETPEQEQEYIAQRLVDAKHAKKLVVDTERVRLEQAGASYTFPDEIVGTIQTRNADDIRNIQGVTTAALVLMSQGVTTPVIMFRDHEDVIHALTPEQAIAMGMFTQQFISNTYQWAWDKKAEIDATNSIEQLNAVVI